MDVTCVLRLMGPCLVVCLQCHTTQNLCHSAVRSPSVTPCISHTPAVQLVHLTSLPCHLCRDKWRWNHFRGLMLHVQRSATSSCTRWSAGEQAFRAAGVGHRQDRCCIIDDSGLMCYEWVLRSDEHIMCTCGPLGTLSCSNHTPDSCRRMYSINGSRHRRLHLLGEVSEVQSNEVLELLVAQSNLQAAHLRACTDGMRSRLCIQRCI